MSGKTPGQRAYEAHAVPGESEWGELDDVDREFWEGIAAAGAAPAHARTAELLSELDAVRAENERLSGLLADAVNPTAQDYDNAAEILDLRELIAEILTEVSGWTVIRADLKQIAKWRKRAEPEPAITGAGTEHAVRQLLDDRDPDGVMHVDGTLRWQRVADMPAEGR